MSDLVANTVNVLSSSALYVYSFLPRLTAAVSEEIDDQQDDFGDWVADMTVNNLIGTPLVRMAGLSGALAVCMGAYGAHALKDKEDIPREQKLAFETGNRYHLIHSAALMAIPLCSRPILTSSLMLSGMTLFSGSCYHYALTGETKTRKVTPFGGILLIMAWLSMAI